VVLVEAQEQLCCVALKREQLYNVVLSFAVWCLCKHRNRFTIWGL